MVKREDFEPGHIPILLINTDATLGTKTGGQVLEAVEKGLTSCFIICVFVLLSVRLWSPSVRTETGSLSLL